MIRRPPRSTLFPSTPLFRSEQSRASREAVDGMQGMPVTIRTLDVGADKPLDKAQPKDYYLNPALGLRAIRWSLADPAMFRTQLRAILRAAAHGQIHLLFPMLAHQSEIEDRKSTRLNSSHLVISYAV